MMRLAARALVVLFSMTITGCGDRPDTSTAGIGQTCPASGCAEGQDCVTAAGPGGDTSTCEIKCDADEDCPANWKCNLPPVIPGSIPNVCIEE